MAELTDTTDFKSKCYEDKESVTPRVTDSSRSTGSTPHAEFLQRTIAFGRRLFIPRSPVATPHWRRGPGRHSQAHGASQTDASRSRGSLSPAGLGPLTRPLPLCRPTACVVLTTVPAGHPRRLAPVPWALPMPGWAWANAVQLTWRVPAAAGWPACRDQCHTGSSWGDPHVSTEVCAESGSRP